MNRHRPSLCKDDSGAAAVEAVLAIPIVIVFISLLMQFGVAFYAQAGMFHATGEAARFATLYPAPSDARIRAVAQGSEYGLDPAHIDQLLITRGVDNGRNFAEIKMDYTVPLISLIPKGPNITLTESRRAYTH